MERRRRYAFTPLQKTILWMGVLLCIWRFLQVPAVFDALLKFCAAGELPWTDTTLSPDATIWGVIGVCVVGALIICYRLFFAGRTKRISAPAPLVQVTQEPLPPIQVAPVVAKQPIVILQRPSFAARLIARIRSHAYTVWHRTRPAALHTWKTAYRVSVRLGFLAKTYSIEAWRMFEPYARRFDAWLRIVLNNYRYTAIAVSIARECTRLLADIRKGLRKLQQQVQSHIKQ